jgi:hypothetical protein
MKHLKYFKESQSEITLKDKLESIVNMYQYLWSNKINPDSLRNFTGNCSVLFTGCMTLNRGWDISKKEGRPYEFDVDCLLKKLENDYRKEEKLKNIEVLYKLSIIPKFKHTKEEVEQFLSPVLNLEVTGDKIIKSYEIEPYFSGWDKKACFTIMCNINEEFLPMDELDVEIKKDNGYFDRKYFKEIEDEFYSCERLIKSKIHELDLQKFGLQFSSMDDNTHLGLYFKFNIRLLEI